MIPSLLVMRAAALQTIRGRLGYRDVQLMQHALQEFMGPTPAAPANATASSESAAPGSAAASAEVPDPEDATVNPFSAPDGKPVVDIAPLLPTEAVPPPESSSKEAEGEYTGDRADVSGVTSLAFPEIDVVVTNDIGGTELPLMALRVEDIHVSSLSWHFQKRQVNIAGKAGGVVRAVPAALLCYCTFRWCMQAVTSAGCVCVCF